MTVTWHRTEARKQHSLPLTPDQQDFRSPSLSGCLGTRVVGCPRPTVTCGCLLFFLTLPFLCNRPFSSQTVAGQERSGHICVLKISLGSVDCEEERGRWHLLNMSTQCGRAGGGRSVCPSTGLAPFLQEKVSTGTHTAQAACGVLRTVASQLAYCGSEAVGL